MKPISPFTAYTMVCGNPAHIFMCFYHNVSWSIFQTFLGGLCKAIRKWVQACYRSSVYLTRRYKLLPAILMSTKLFLVIFIPLCLICLPGMAMLIFVKFHWRFGSCCDAEMAHQDWRQDSALGIFGRYFLWQQGSQVFPYPGVFCWGRTIQLPDQLGAHSTDLQLPIKQLLFANVHENFTFFRNTNWNYLCIAQFNFRSPCVLQKLGTCRTTLGTYYPFPFPSNQV